MVEKQTILRSVTWAVCLLGAATNESSQPVVPSMLLKARLFGLLPTQTSNF